MTTRFSEYIAKKTLYVSRDLLNGSDVVAWAKQNGCKTCLKPDQMHVTLCYSKTPMNWPKPLTDHALVPHGGHKEVKKFDGGALVLHFVYDPFTQRAMELRGLGASSDYPDYKAHITLTYESDGIDPEDFEPYTGNLLFGPEKFKEIDDEKTWKNENLEEARSFANHSSWGIMKLNGTIIDGATHPTAICHGDLSDEAGLASEDTIDYAHNRHVDGMLLRTKSNESLKAAIKHFAKLPHKGLRVTHEHFDDEGDMVHTHSGPANSVLNAMKRFKTNHIMEAKYWHKDVNAWGLVTSDGVRNGNADKWARSHEDLGNRERGYADYYKDKATDTLHIRTHSKESLNWAVQHFDKLPHGRRGNVVHEHFDHSECGDHADLRGCKHKVSHSHEGKRYQVLP